MHMSTAESTGAVLVGVDGSVSSRVAVDWGARYAKLHNQPLRLVNIISSPVMMAWPEAPLPDGYLQWQEEQSRDLLDAAVATAAASSNCRFFWMRVMASRTLAMSAPPRAHSSSDSATAPMVMPTIIWLASLASCPAPCGPTWVVVPRCCSTGSARAKRNSSSLVGLEDRRLLFWTCRLSVYVHPFVHRSFLFR